MVRKFYSLVFLKHDFFQPNDEIALDEELWFHGTIDRKDVPILLKKDGDYLVRESSTKPGQFVLSTRSTVDGSLKHFIIQSEDVSTALALPSNTLYLSHLKAKMNLTGSNLISFPF